MQKKNGQALVEFILILPVLIMILMAIIDFGTIFTKRYQLQSDLDYIVDLYHNKQNDEIKAYSSKEKIQVNIEENNTKATIEVSMQMKINTPLLNLAFPNPYVISLKRVVMNE